MINRIDLFMPPFSQYGVLSQMTEEIYDAMKRAGISARLLTAEYNNPKPFIEALTKDRPQFTFSLNGLLPTPDGAFFCDMIDIPHIACLLDSPNQFSILINSKRNYITCPDVYATYVFRELGAENVFFFPHGVDRNLAPDPSLQRSYDVVFLGSCIDYEKIAESWKTKYPDRLRRAMHQAAETALSDQSTPYVEAFVDALNDHVSKSEPLDPEQCQMMDILQNLEMYIRGKDRISLLRAVKDARLDIFGAGLEAEAWKKYFKPEQKNVHIHPGVPFPEALQIMKQSKIVLNSCPWIKHGTHERILSGMACGALVITSENPYMSEHFNANEEIVYYHHGKWNHVSEAIHKYLKDEPKRAAIAEKGRQKVLKGHTWDHRVAALLEQLSAKTGK